jgi:DNA recombination protein RmuC
MQVYLIVLVVFLLLINLYCLIKLASKESKNVELITLLNKLSEDQKSEFKLNRVENNDIARLNREEISRCIKEYMDIFNQNQNEKFTELKSKQNELIQNTEKKLEYIRESVEEKLQKTLHERLGHSFETVGKQLEAVQIGLGEMKTLATDVGGLKKVLSNVKMRGGIGEVQLSMLLEQILAPVQYQANVKTKNGSKHLVEFAVKLPGKEEGLDQVWLPIDAKFPKDVYEHLLSAHDTNDLDLIEQAHKNLENTLKKMAKDISDKYIDPPYTTDFAILFLPFEGIYAEVVRRASLFDELQQKYKIIVTGPTTLAAILNSFHMGFKTLAIQKRSGEVWTTLGAVKNEFEKFGGLLEKVQKNIKGSLDDLDILVGTRSNMIRSKLKSVESLTDEGAKQVLYDETIK